MSDEEMQCEDSSPKQTVLEEADENTLRIMLSTDNHLGYNERDAVRGMDSFAAFEEVLCLAKRFECDMVLIAGDLFHENKPSRHTLYKAMEIIRRYCMGDNPVRIQILSDQAKNFPTGVVNYQDPNYSVDLPIFSIHGNHDDPVRDGNGQETALAALDLLSVSNLVNYMGKQDKIESVEVSPVLLQKGTTKIALYGLGSMRDERLNRMWNSKKVRFLRPSEDINDEEENDEEDTGGFFNIFALHQNRDLGRGSKNCIQESMIPEWMDLVVWGHEHECLIEFFESVVGTFRITQPGSSVATSLVAGEAARKKVGVLDILGKQFRLHTIPLTQVRSFVTTEVSLKEHSEELEADDPRLDEKMTAILEEEVRVMVLNARDKRKEVLEEAAAAGSNAGMEDSPLKYKLEKSHEVLVRLRVEHSGFTTLNNQRFGAKFVGEVANPEDILLFHRKKEQKPSSSSSRSTRKSAPIPPEELARTNLEDLVHEHLDAPESKLELFSEKTLGGALEDYVDKILVSSIDDAADGMLGKRQKTLIKRKDKEGDENEANEKDVSQDTGDSGSSRRQKGRANKTVEFSEDDDIVRGKENDHMEVEVEDSDDAGPPKQRNKHGQAKASRASGGTGKRAMQNLDEDTQAATAGRKAPGDAKRKAARRQKLADFDSDDSEIEIVEKPKGKSQSGSSRRSSNRARRVNYKDSDEEEDDDDESAHAAGGGGGDDDDDDIEFLGTSKQKSKKSSKSATASRARKTASTSNKKSTSTKGKATRTSRSTSAKSRRFDDDSDDEVYRSTADLDDDWGSTNTRQHL